MFTSERIACYLNMFSGHGDDNETKELKLVFHINPITPELAMEISPKLADRLFRKDSLDEWQPACEITKASFSSINVPMQNIAFHDLPEPGLLKDDAVLVLGCAISNLRAQRDVTLFRLEFDVVVPMDSITMELVERFYKSACFLTMQPVQREMTYSEDSAAREHQMSLQDAADEPDTDKETKSGRGRKKRQAEAAAVDA